MFLVKGRLDLPLKDAVTEKWHETIDATARAFLETHKSRTRYLPLDAAVRGAQNARNGDVVLGSPVTAWGDLDLESAVTRCWINGEPGGQGKPGDALGHPL